MASFCYRCGDMKGQINIVELIFVIIALLIAFSILFPGFSYQSKWPAALLLLGSKDLILTMDRIGKLYEYSFDSVAFLSFIDSAAPASKTNWIIWPETEGTIKNEVIVACNCTRSQADFLETHTTGLIMNGREVSIDFITSNLDKINEPSDALVIWGDKDLAPYKQQLIDYLNKGNGVVEIADFQSPDAAEKEIFGIERCDLLGIPCGWGDVNYDSFIVPESFNSTAYLPYKYFYHVPYPEKAYEKVGSIPIEGGIGSCSDSETWKGNFTFRGTPYTFWICESTSTAYFDINLNGNADTKVLARTPFAIGEYTFFLSYVGKYSISISFRPVYKFADFVTAGNTKIYITDSDVNRIAVSKGNYSNSLYPIPVALLSPKYKAAWVADFTRSGVSAIGHDHMNLLTSLIFWSSNKKEILSLYRLIKLGQLASYVNIKDYTSATYDMYEVYRLNLGVAYPY